MKPRCHRQRDVCRLQLQETCLFVRAETQLRFSLRIRFTALSDRPLVQVLRKIAVKIANAWYCRQVNWRFRILPVVALLEWGCSRSESDIRVWRPSDHEQEVEVVASGQPNEAPNLPRSTPQAINQNARSTWDSLCVGCHGPVGQGDGTSGGSMGARNLSDPKWQASVSDSQIVTSITSGRGRMPAFSLPQETLAGLVRLIRSMSSASKSVQGR